MAPRTSAGILLYRLTGSGTDGFEVLLAHPGGP
jgi:predicted NUDIX family NTP pyrophosphohydrolase